MKYLTLLQDLDYRGSQRVAQNYSVGMKILGHDVRVLTLDRLGTRAEYLEMEGINCACIATQLGSIDRVSEWSPDIVHIHRAGIYDEKINQIIIDIKNRINPLIIETSIFSRVDYKIPPNIIDVHLHLTKWCLWKWTQWSKSLPYQPLATILPNSIMANEFYRSSLKDIRDLKNKLGIPLNDFVFGRIGANCESKWHPLIVDGFKHINKIHQNISLLLVSPPPSIIGLIEDLPLDLKKKVFISPRLESDRELRLLYSSMDVMLHAARIGESFGIVLAESLLCETPVIALSSPTKDNSQIEIVKHQQTGLVANTPTAFVQAMNEVYCDREKVREFGKNGRLDILANYQNEHVCSRLEFLCKLLLDNRQQIKSRLPQLLSSNNFVTEVPDFMDVLDGFYGKVSFQTKLMTKIVHQPQLYRFYVDTILAAKHN
jgi:glycosyltransferase involved in cell wall biosynthesis